MAGRVSAESDISFGAECLEGWSLLVEDDQRVAVH